MRSEQKICEGAECIQQTEVQSTPKRKLRAETFVLLAIIIGFFSGIAYVMGAAPMLNTCLYLMAICVLTGALGKILVEFGVVDLIEKILRPLMSQYFGFLE